MCDGPLYTKSHCHSSIVLLVIKCQAYRSEHQYHQFHVEFLIVSEPDSPSVNIYKSNLISSWSFPPLLIHVDHLIVYLMVLLLDYLAQKRQDAQANCSPHQAIVSSGICQSLMRLARLQPPSDLCSACPE